MTALYDVAIVGAGPGGCATALKLKDSGLSVLLIDKASFPRDKICGDALSFDVTNQLGMIDPQLASDLAQIGQPAQCKGISIISPAYHRVDLRLWEEDQSGRTGYVIPRYDFDHLLFKAVESCSNVSIEQGARLKDFDVSEQGVSLHTSKGKFTAKMVVAADGGNSRFQSTVGWKSSKEEYSAGLRQYWQGVDGFESHRFIELHFIKDMLPGYFWVFPMADGKANVGMGLLTSEVSKQRLNIKELFADIIKNHPTISPRFKSAEPLEDIKGCPLALGGSKRPISSNRVLLVGDAAGLIDPFSGEGIGNAIRSGRVAADTIRQAFAQNDFSANQLKAYDEEVYRRMLGELQLGQRLQKLSRKRWLFDYVAKKAANNKVFHYWLERAMHDPNLRQEMTKASFYWKLPFAHRK